MTATILSSGLNRTGLGLTSVGLLLALMTVRTAWAGPHHFDEWAAGRIASVNAAQRTLELRSEGRAGLETFRWDHASRVWRPDGPKGGELLEGHAPHPGELVKIQFRKAGAEQPALILKIVEQDGPK